LPAGILAEERSPKVGKGTSHLRQNGQLTSMEAGQVPDSDDSEAALICGYKSVWRYQSVALSPTSVLV
jgi:hypothetical protein